MNINIKVTITFFLFFFNCLIVSSSEINTVCNWENTSSTPCVEIKKKIPNSSEFTKKGINRIIITKKEIQDSGAIDLIDALKLVPDINITQSGPKGQQASMFMRGTGSNHVLVLINGIPINDQSTTQGLHDFGVDFIQTVEQIEIYPGSSATHFGTNAIGGAINIILTNDYRDNISLSGDKKNNYELIANKVFILDNSSLNFKLGNIRNKTISARGNVDDEKDGVENFTANINFEKYLKPNLRLFSTSYLRQTISEYDGSNTNQIGYEGDNKMTTLHLGLNDNRNGKKQNSTVYYNLYDREYDELGTIDNYKSEVLGIKYDLSKTINENFSFGLGSEYKYDWGYFDNNGSYSASTKGNVDNLTIYTNLGLNILGDTNLSVFLRNDNHKQAGNNSTYKLNINKDIGKFNLGLSRMTGLRNPTLYELYGTDNFGYSGNNDLKAEKSITNEFSLIYKINNKLLFNSTFFNSKINNNIEYVSNQYVNDTDNIDLKQNGVNSSINFKNKNTNLNLYSSYLNSHKENGSDQLRRPNKNYGLNLSQHLETSLFGDFIFNLSYQHYGKHFDTHSSTFSTIEMDSTDLIDIKLSKSIFDKEIYFKISNLLKENYQRPHGYNQDLRLVKFGIRY